MENMKSKSPHNRRPSSAPRRKRLTILLVDDEPAMRMLVRMLLEYRSAAKVVEAASNAQALRAARRKKFDLVISDYGRADGDGLAFLGEFKALNPKTPVMIFSGQAGAIRQRARRLGASACISKMIKQSELKLVERVLAAA